MRVRSQVLTLLSLAMLTASIAADQPRAQSMRIEKGTIDFQPVDDQAHVPECYRLSAHQFDYEMKPKTSLPSSGIDVFIVRFPSPIETPCVENNTVYAEYYRPRGNGPFPATIILDITAGDQRLSRTIATQLAQRGIAGLFVQMAYYGPRRPPGSDLRLLAPDYRHTLAAVRQTVLDMRRAAAWLAARPELDAKRLAILGTSLGSFVAALTSEMEPRLGRVVVLLGGGGLVDAYYDDPRVEPFRKLWEALGGTKARLTELIAPADPITCATNLRGRKLLMIAARRDEIVPPRAAEALWEAAGRQKIVWYDCGHYGAALYFLSALEHVIAHLIAK